MDTVCVTMQRSARDAPLGFRLVGVHAPFRVDAVVPGQRES